MLFSKMFGFKTIRMSPGCLKRDVLCHERQCSPWKDFFQVTGQLGSKHVKEDCHYRCKQAEKS